MKFFFTLTTCLLLFSFTTWAGKLVFVPVNETNNLETLFGFNDLKIHYYNDDFVLATAVNEVIIDGIIVLDENAFSDGKRYAIVYCFENEKDEYLSRTNDNGKPLYSGDHFFIMQILSGDFAPAKNDGMVAIRDIEARLPRAVVAYPIITEPDETVLEILAQVSTDSVMLYIQTLQDFGTRICLHPTIDAVQDWIMKKYESFGLDVTIQPFSFHGNGANNVIAIQHGTEFPDEYVVCGAHYDSFTYEAYYNGTFNNAPGADDNASGCAGILEAARILSKYDTKRSIIYCSFSAEELGLFGSSFFAEKCANEKMNIVGYFNLDMIGFLKEGEDIHIDYIYPYTAKPLADYSINICDVYFSEFPVRHFTSLPWGDSDHTSFNKMGYHGVWPFEDPDCDSPYIHHIPDGTMYGGCSTPCLGTVPCLGDVIGPSVNNPEQVSVFTKVNLACVAMLALHDQAMPPKAAPPTNCVASVYNKTQIKITWKAPEGEKPKGYYLYRDGVKALNSLIEYNLTYFDKVKDYEIHCYKVSAYYGIFESNFSNESCAGLPNYITEYNTNIKIYPNPTTGQLTFENGQLTITGVEIYDVLGKKQLSIVNSQLSIETIDISHLQAGIYFVKVNSELIGKFVKE